MIQSVRLTASSLICLSVVFTCNALAGMRTGLKDASGHIPFSEEFVRDYNAAENALKATGAVDPFHALLKKYRHPNELAELELTLGVIYCQRTGFVASDKAVTHLTRALDYNLPEEAYLNTLLWRASSFEQLGKRDDAIRDHLRGLLACSNYATPSERPELLPPSTGFSIEPETEAEREAKRDYERYRSGVLLQQHIHRQRGYFAQAIRRLTNGQDNTEDKLKTMLEKITPDPVKRENVLDETLAATQSRTDEPATLLNGTWQYVAAIESDRITTYDQSLAMQLVILNDTWAMFKEGALVHGTVENVEYNQQTSPVSCVRRKGKAPHAVGYAILKVTDDHLIYTTTPLDATRFGATSGATGNYVPDPQSGDQDVHDPFGRTGLGIGRLHQHPPKSFSPEGTSNTQYILRRINDSTSAMSQITER